MTPTTTLRREVTHERICQIFETSRRALVRHERICWRLANLNLPCGRCIALETLSSAAWQALDMASVRDGEGA